MIDGQEQVILPDRVHPADAGQHREGARRHRGADGGRQRCAARRAAGDRWPRGWARRSWTQRPQARADPVPRHHRLSRRSGSPAAPAAATACCSTSRDPAHPTRIGAVADSNFSYWHSATFNNDGTKILFSDEWGGGGQPKCRATDRHEWGADAIFTLSDRQMHFQSYYKMPAAQTAQENCVAHNGSLIPIPGRDVMVQAWYQGGISVFDWTDAAHPKEIAFFDRGPVDCDPARERRVVVVLLVQRRDRQLRDRPGARHLRAAAEPADLAERDRRRARRSSSTT